MASQNLGPPPNFQMVSDTPTTITVSWEVPTQLVLTPGASGPIVPPDGSHWTLDRGGNILRNGAAVAGGGGTSLLTIALSTGVMWGQDAASKTWWSWVGHWDGPHPTPVKSLTGAVYMVFWRPTGSPTWFATPQITATQITIVGLAPATKYDLEVETVSGN